MRRLCGIVLACVLSPAIAQAYATLPQYIPTMPGFADTVCNVSMAPSPWTTPTAGYYAVSSSGTDTANQYGTPTAPRRTIPKPIPAGAFVEIFGTYNEAYDVWGSSYLQSGGTAEAPVCITGAPGHVITNLFGHRNGNYIVFDGLNYIPTAANCAGSCGFGLQGPSQYVVVRNSNIQGTVTPAAGTFILGTGPGATDYMQFTMLLDNTIHTMGDYQNLHPEVDTDTHCVKPYYGAFFTWILNSDIYQCGGDSVQGDAGHNTDDELNVNGLRYMFIGGNTAHSNRQTGFWLKHGRNWIVASNLVYDMVQITAGGDGACIGGQYAPVDYWIIGNLMVACNNGFRIASNDVAEQRISVPVYLIGNIIRETLIGPAISYWSSTYAVTIWNTIYDAPCGYCEPDFHNYGYRYVLNNIFDEVGIDPGFTLQVAGSVASKQALFTGNVFQLPYRQDLGGTISTLTTPLSTDSGRWVTDVGMIDPAAGLYGLEPGSPAINFQPYPLNGLNAGFLAGFSPFVFPVDLNTDYAGHPRFIGTTTGAGALAYTGSVPPPPPPPPVVPAEPGQGKAQLRRLTHRRGL